MRGAWVSTGEKSVSRCAIRSELAKLVVLLIKREFR